MIWFPSIGIARIALVPTNTHPGLARRPSSPSLASSPGLPPVQVCLSADPKFRPEEGVLAYLAAVPAHHQVRWPSITTLSPFLLPTCACIGFLHVLSVPRSCFCRFRRPLPNNDRLFAGSVLMALSYSSVAQRSDFEGQSRLSTRKKQVDQKSNKHACIVDRSCM